MANPVIHFEVSGKDLEKLRTFYTSLFDWTTQDYPEMSYSTVDKVGDGIAGGIGQVSDGGDGHVTFYVGTDDPQATLDQAVSLGGSVVMPVTELPMVTLAMFTDPEGHMVGIVKN